MQRTHALAAPSDYLYLYCPVRTLRQDTAQVLMEVADRIVRYVARPHGSMPQIARETVLRDATIRLALPPFSQSNRDRAAPFEKSRGARSHLSVARFAAMILGATPASVNTKPVAAPPHGNNAGSTSEQETHRLVPVYRTTVTAHLTRRMSGLFALRRADKIPLYLF
jgi:hypothetical protein